MVMADKTELRQPAPMGKIRRQRVKCGTRCGCAILRIQWQYQQFIHLSRYSRWLEDEGRRETWGETIERYFNFFEEHLKEMCDYDLDNKTKYGLPIFFNKAWRFYDDLMDVGIILYLPKDQNIDNWEEMISIQRIDAQGQGAKKLYTNLMEVREKNCPGKNVSKILKDSKNAICYEAITEACGEFDFQAEWTVILSPPKLTLLQYTLWKVEYVVKNKNWDQFMTPEKLEWLQNIKLLTGKELKTYIATD